MIERYIMENLNKKTNSELNSIVASNLNDSRIPHGDFCSDWRLTGLLQVNLRISLNPYEDGSNFWSGSTDTSFFCDDICPQRAIVMAWITETLKSQ